jgi:hypothetical protein
MTYLHYRGGVSGDFDPERESDARLLLQPYFLKRKEYESENEVRYVTAGTKRPIHNGVLLKGTGPEKWILSIRLWPGITSDEEECLCSVVKRVLPKVDCAKSELLTAVTMARKIRIEYPGALYHAMNRGDRREAIFKDVAR